VGHRTAEVSTGSVSDWWGPDCWSAPR